MLRLFLDYNDGSSQLRCPVCHRRLVLAVERLGRMLVAYQNGFRMRPGHPALLVCPDYACTYREPVEITDEADDAVIFDPLGGGHAWSTEHDRYRRTLGSLAEEIRRLRALYRETGNLKLPAAIRVWREEYYRVQSHIRQGLIRSLEDDCEIQLDFYEDSQQTRGRVRGLLHDAFLFEKSETGQTVLIHTGDLRLACRVFGFGMGRRPQRFDFGDPAPWPVGVRIRHLPDLFVVVGGYTLQYEGVTKYGVCRASTADPQVARALGIFNEREQPFVGEFPAVLVDRCFRLIRYAQVRGYRLQVVEGTNRDDLFKLRTREMAAAQALRMNRPLITWDSRRETLYWEGLFSRGDMDAFEEIAVDVRLPRKRRGR